MLKHLGQRFLLGLMVLQTLVAGFYPPAPRLEASTADVIRPSVSPPSDAAPDCGLACCAQADSPFGSPAAKLCCEVFCGKPSGDAPAPPPQSSSPETVQPAAQSLLSISFLAEPMDAVASRVLSRSFEAGGPLQTPSPLFLTNSVFRI